MAIVVPNTIRRTASRVSFAWSRAGGGLARLGDLRLGQRGKMARARRRIGRVAGVPEGAVQVDGTVTWRCAASCRLWNSSRPLSEPSFPRTRPARSTTSFDCELLDLGVPCCARRPKTRAATPESVWAGGSAAGLEPGLPAACSTQTPIEARRKAVVGVPTAATPNRFCGR